jgi:hypothetical protein
MFDSDENEGNGQNFLLGCPVGLALVMVGVLLVLVVGGSIMAFAFPSTTPVPNAEDPLAATLPAEANESGVITEEADAVIVTAELDATEELDAAVEPDVTDEAELTTEAADGSDEADATLEVTTDVTAES